MSEERVGGRAGTAAPQGVVCELPNPPNSWRFLPSEIMAEGLSPGVEPGLLRFGSITCAEEWRRGQQKASASQVEAASTEAGRGMSCAYGFVLAW